MKKLIAVIFLMFAVSQLFAVPQWYKEVSETDNFYSVHIWCTGLDTTTANATSTSMSIDARPFLGHFLRGNLTAYTARDTTVDTYVRGNDVYANTLVNGTGTADSLTYVYLQYMPQDGSALVTFDTLGTAKTTEYRNVVNMVNTLGTSWYLKVAVKDLTVSMYAGRFDCTIYFAKP